MRSKYPNCWRNLYRNPGSYVRVVKLTDDFRRDINLAIATNTALKGMLEFLKEHAEELKKGIKSKKNKNLEAH